jgi:hypothetical protein
MNTFEIKKMIYDYIFEFEHQNRRAITAQEFIDAIPVIYHIIKDTKPGILGKLTKEEFVFASQMGYKYQNSPSEFRVAVIQQEYDNIRRQNGTN